MRANQRGSLLSTLKLTAMNDTNPSNDKGEVALEITGSTGGGGQQWWGRWWVLRVADAAMLAHMRARRVAGAWLIKTSPMAQLNRSW